ncbi:nucleoside hydrolase [Ruania rhizosphaerae]|uniref:nucleoside hydrolase n=1 Tax=Ruania rhizosphaerae TaxID=1840413 RepID=UPI00135B8007|nr:nucleoside hydrolase [Ruania rhizosphaerae]
MTLPRPGLRRRVIVNTDAMNEADDQFAIVHALLTPMFDLRGLIAAHFGAERSATSMEDSREEIDHLLQLMDLGGTVRVENGSPRALPDESTPEDSAGARLIIEEAMKDDGPLYVAFLGPLTDMASAILLEPAIAERDVVVVWIGGGPYGDRIPAYWPEFNLRNDVASANVVLASGVEVWQVPMSTYVMMGVSYAELDEKVTPCGAIGKYLTRQVIEFNAGREGSHGPMEHRSLGDSPAIGLMMSPGSAVWREQSPVRFGADHSYEPSDRGRPIKVCEHIDSRLVLEDMFAKLRAFTAKQ